MKTNFFIGAVIALLLAAASCKKEKASEVSACMQSVIDSAMSKPVGSDFVQISTYKYQGATVYLLVPGCCDRYIQVWDENCKYLFAPSGGITGHGDGTHPDFYTTASFQNLVWKDPRY